MFRYWVETERRSYLANDVDVEVRTEGGRTYFAVELRDAWVLDMFRTNRFLPRTRLLSFKDVVVEELPKDDIEVPDEPDSDETDRRPGVVPLARRARGCRRGARRRLVRGRRLRGRGPQLDLPDGEIDLVAPATVAPSCSARSRAGPVGRLRSARRGRHPGQAGPPPPARRPVAASRGRRHRVSCASTWPPSSATSWRSSRTRSRPDGQVGSNSPSRAPAMNAVHSPAVYTMVSPSG